MDTSIQALFGLLLLALAGAIAFFNVNRVINYIAQICECQNFNAFSDKFYHI